MTQRSLAPPLGALILLAGFSWLLWAGQSSVTAPITSAPVPEQFDLWVGTPMDVQQRAIEILETEDVSLMEYRMGQEPPVWLARVSGFGNRAAFHPPELCYVGSHFEVLGRETITVLVNGKERRVMRLVLSQGKEQFEAWYWFTASHRVTPNYYEQQAWLLVDAIKRQPVSGTLVRISTPIDRPEHTHRRLLAFIKSWDTAS